MIMLEVTNKVEDTDTHKLYEVVVPQEFANAGLYEVWMTRSTAFNAMWVVNVYNKDGRRLFSDDALDLPGGWRMAMRFLTEDMPLSMEDGE